MGVLAAGGEGARFIFGCTSVAKAADIENLPVFAAVNRCATQRQKGPRSTQESLASLGGQPGAAVSTCSVFLGVYFRKRISAATKPVKTTEITPFMVKKAALSLVRSVGLTRECS
jgi:hypothetical protein